MLSIYCRTCTTTSRKSELIKRRVKKGCTSRQNQPSATQVSVLASTKRELSGKNGWNLRNLTLEYREYPVTTVWHFLHLTDLCFVFRRISQSHFCWVFKWGTKEEWEFGLERYLKYPSSHKQADRYYLLKTLVSCPSDAWNVERWGKGENNVSLGKHSTIQIINFCFRLLNMTMLDPNSTITDGNARFILSVLSNRAGYTALFNLLSQNWDVIRKR